MYKINGLFEDLDWVVLDLGFGCSSRHVRHNVKGAGDDIHKQLVAGAGGQLEFVIALARQIESGHTYQGNERDSLLMSDPLRRVRQRHNARLNLSRPCYHEFQLAARARH